MTFLAGPSSSDDSPSSSAICRSICASVILSSFLGQRSVLDSEGVRDTERNLVQANDTF